MFGERIHLLQPQRKLKEQFLGFYMIEPNSKEPKNIAVFLFSDCLVIANEYPGTDRFDYIAHTEFHQWSYVYAKQDLKYYQNLLKIVGEHQCFIVGAKSAEVRDLAVEKIKTEIENVQKNISVRMSLLEEKKDEDRVDVEIVCTEWQGEKMVYVIEVRQPKMRTHRTFRRYKYMEDCYQKVKQNYPHINVPEISKKQIMNSKTELIERRLVNFELFF